MLFISFLLSPSLVAQRYADKNTISGVFPIAIKEKGNAEFAFLGKYRDSKKSSTSRNSLWSWKKILCS
ncbi:MAG: hypothetical protein HQM10_16775 [Candidatus Riflebacteria bacterium]|nr:hypothetical protein [Candidatus Riflebacteria bacterium]